MPARRLGSVRLWIDAPHELARELILDEGAEILLGAPDRPAAREVRVTHDGDTVQVEALDPSRGDLAIQGVRVERAWLDVGAAFEVGQALVRVEPLGQAPEEDARPLPGIVGSSRAMRRLAATVRKVAPLRLPALVRGETGTGKDLVARAIHDESPRRHAPFVSLNAAAISRELAESELFGHVRGAFTGASRDRRGAFREASGGTLFLDEIGALPLELQAKLLRVVEEGVVRPVGGEAGIDVDVRLVAATCEPLEAMVLRGAFRADLYERLAVFRVTAPPLRERTEDIEALGRHLLAASGLGGRALTKGAITALRSRSWPGNVRQLRNVLAQAAVVGPGPIDADAIAAVLAAPVAKTARLVGAEALRVFEEVGRNVSEAARRAELPRTTMRDLLRSAGVPAQARTTRRARVVGV